MQQLPPGYEPVEWTPDRVARFWDFVSKVQPDQYFAKQVGPQIVERFRPLVARSRRIVDFGCGLGFLLEALASTGKPISGFDLSEASLAATRARLAGCPTFDGAFGLDRVPEHAGAFDLGFCLEVVEHLDDAALEAALAGMRGMLAPGGRLVVSTPNDEDLSASWIMSPESGRIFHRWQHVRSWTGETLSARLAAAGYAVEEVMTCNAAALGRSARAIALRGAMLLLRRKDPNLLVVARRP